MADLNRPVRRDHPRLARILGFVGALVLIVSILVDPINFASDWLSIRFLQVALTIVVICFSLRSYKISTQFEFDLWGAAIIVLSNTWLLLSAWVSGFANGPVVGLFLVINASNYLAPNGKFLRIYALALAAGLTIAVLTASELLVNPFLFLSAFYFYLLCGLVAMTKILADRDRLEANEEILKESRDRAEDAARARHEFMTNMSHELRTPLNGIIGMTNLLDKSNLESSQKDMIGTIEMSGQLLLSLINGILDFAKLEATGVTILKTENEVENSCAQCVDLVMPLALRKGISLYLDIETKVPDELIFDSIKTSQILVNLLNNALKFTDEGSVILTISIETSNSAESLLVCEVKDTGVGIPEEQQKIIFEEFSQGDLSASRRFGGTGLGLTICRRLLEAMGGSISVDSTFGEGSTFTAKIPVDLIANNRAEPQIAHPKDTCLKNKNCLVSTRDQIQQSICKRKLTSWGLHTTGVETVIKAFQYLNEIEDRNRLPTFLIFELDQSDPNLDLIYEKLAKIYLTKPYQLLILSHTKKLGAESKNSFTLINPIRMSTLKNSMTTALLGSAPSLDSQLPNRLEESPELHKNDLKILVAEDNRINQKVALAILKNLGLDADIAANGLEAVEKVEANDYDVILMDVQMPEMDGLSATREIRRKQCMQPLIIAMTANAFEQDKLACLDAGMDSFISKPVSVEALEKALPKFQ